MPKPPTRLPDLEESGPIEVRLSDTRSILIFNPPSTNHVPNLRLQKEFPTDAPRFKRFKHERAFQLELGIRVVRALMAENNRTTVGRDHWPRSRTERFKGIRQPPSKRSFRKDPWFLDGRKN